MAASIFGSFTADGLPVGFYSSDVHDSIPADAIRITEAQWREFLDNQGRRKWDAATSSVVLYTPPVPAPVADDVRREARRRILARYPDWKQHNMTMRGVELQDIWRRLSAWTASEQAEANALQAAADWIKSVRAASNTMEPSPPADYTADKHWPT